jgi:STE24 endopeptidase
VDVRDDRDAHVPWNVVVARRLHLPLALVTAAVVAEAAVLLLRPRDGVIAPADVSAASYFTPAQLQRATDFRGPQTALYGLRVLIELGVLVAVVRRPPRRLLEARRQVLAGAAAGAALSVVTSAAALPVAAVARQRAIDVGLVTQSWPGWAGDLAKGWTIGAVIAGAGGAVAVVLLRRFRRRWWLPASALVVAFAIVITYAGPVLIDPLFNKFEPVPAGRTREDVLELARRAGVDVGQVQVMDASRRTTAANAYVAGLGHTKRVVLYDTLVENFKPDELRLVVAHELAHVHYRDVPHGILWVALVAPAAMFAAAQLARRFAPRGADEAPASALPALALALALVVPVISTISLQLSRRVEARADSFALRLTDAPEPFIGFERRIAVRNVSDPDPPAWQVALLATHPPTIDRIGIGVAYERTRSTSAGG